jgi:hypothetical protein
MADERHLDLQDRRDERCELRQQILRRGSGTELTTQVAQTSALFR